MNINLDLICCSICITYFRFAVIIFSGGCRILWIILVVYVCINLICGDWVWQGWRLIKVNYSFTKIISAIVLWLGRRVWWYKKCWVGVWVGPVAMGVFVDMQIPLSIIVVLKCCGQSEKLSKSDIFRSFLQKHKLLTFSWYWKSYFDLTIFT